MSRGVAPSYCACSFLHLTMKIQFKHLACSPTVPPPSCIWPSCFSAPGSHASPQTPLCVRTWPHTFTSSQFATRCVRTLLEKCSTKCGETLEFLQKCSAKCGWNTWVFLMHPGPPHHSVGRSCFQSFKGAESRYRSDTRMPSSTDFSEHILSRSIEGLVVGPYW